MGNNCIGMDCGGTRTRGVLSDAAGVILARAFAGPGNPLSAGWRMAARSYRVVILQLLRKARLDKDSVAVVSMGVSGGGRDFERRRIETLLHRVLPRARSVVDTDARIALMGATMGNPGILVICGTGSIVMGIGKDGRTARAGGWGLALGDEGSGAALGKDAVRAVLRAEDGRGRPTCLKEAVFRRFRVRTIDDLISRIYRTPPPPKTYAGLWPDLLAASKEGDRIARALLRQGGEELAETVEAVAAKLAIRNTIPLVLSGGILAGDSLLRRAMLRRLQSSLPRARVMAAAAPPEIGALLVALSLLPKDA
jgi:glucosamine kinase